MLIVYTVVGLLAPGQFLEIIATYGIILTCMSYFILFFSRWFTCMCDDLSYFPFDILYKVAGSPISSESIYGSLAYLRGSLYLIGWMDAFQQFGWSLVCEYMI